MRKLDAVAATGDLDRFHTKFTSEKSESQVEYHERTHASDVAAVIHETVCTIFTCHDPEMQPISLTDESSED